MTFKLSVTLFTVCVYSCVRACLCAFVKMMTIHSINSLTVYQITARLFSTRKNLNENRVLGLITIKRCAHWRCHVSHNGVYFHMNCGNTATEYRRYKWLLFIYKYNSTCSGFNLILPLNIARSVDWILMMITTTTKLLHEEVDNNHI